MRRHLLITATVISLTALAACASTPRSQGAQSAVLPEQQERLGVLQAKGADASVTIFPLVLWNMDKPKEVGDMGSDVANVIGLLLENAGMRNLETSDTAFMLPADVEFDQAAERFGEFVRANPITTDYALYGEFLGRVGRGGPPRFEEVRGVIVDKTGACVWVDRQTPKDRDFKRAKPDCPMTCCVFLTTRLREQLGLPESAGKDNGEGKFARLWADESGTPDRDERSAMDDRLAKMKKTAPDATVAVFPVRLSNDEVDKDGATQLAKLVNDKKLCNARPLDTPLRIELTPDHNEQKVLWDMARAFRDHVRKNPPETAYALYADYMFSERDKHVGAVHFVICDRAGEWVLVDFQNSHHGDFQSIDPKTQEDCNRLVSKRLKGYLH